MLDTLIRGGRIIDPRNGVDRVGDLAIAGERIAAVEVGAPLQARQTIDASGMLVVPGLIDLHVHVHWGVSHYGIDADASCLARGVTTVVDAGSAGAHTWPSLKRWIIDASATEIYAFLNVAYPGMIGDQIGELEDVRTVDPIVATRVAAAPEILGIKARMDRVGANRATDMLGRAIAVAEAVQKPVMVHIGSEARMNDSLWSVLALLRPGDIVTHMYHGKDGGLLDPDGRLQPCVRQARERGVIFDVGHGAGSFSFAVAKRALQQGMTPDTISSDLHTYSLLSPAVDLVTTLSKFLCMGMPLVSVIEAATAAPARLIGQADRLGQLGEGAAADVTILRMDQGDYTYVDCQGEVLRGGQRLSTVATIKRGSLFGLGPASSLGLLTL